MVTGRKVDKIGDTWQDVHRLNWLHIKCIALDGIFINWWYIQWLQVFIFG